MKSDFCYDEKKADTAFRAFLKWIAMDFAMDGENYDVAWEIDEGKYVVTKNGQIVDERGELFMSIQNIFCAMYPNTEYRGEPYIFKNIHPYAKLADLIIDRRECD